MSLIDFSKCKNQLRVLWPAVKRRVRDASGRVIRIDEFEEHWRIDDFQDGTVKLCGIRTKFNLPLKQNDILDDKLSNPGGPDFLYIRSQTIIDGNKIALEPLPR